MTSEDVSFVQHLLDQFVDQVRRGDIAAAADWYADDAIVLPPGLPRIDGKSGVRDFWASSVGELEEFDMTVTDVRRHADDVVEEIGIWSMRLRGEAPNSSGKYVSILRKSSEKWRVITDIWNEGA